MEINRDSEKSVEGLDKKIVWRVLKNMEYEDGVLSKILSLYIIDFTVDNSNKTILVRTSASTSRSFFGDSVEIEFLKDVFSCKFKSKKRSATIKIKEFLLYLGGELNVDLVQKMCPIFISEYKKDINFIKRGFCS